MANKKHWLISLGVALIMFALLLHCGEAKAEPGETEVNWLSVPNATIYRVHWGTEIDKLYMSIAEKYGTKTIIPNLKCNTKYYAIVKAYNGLIPSPPTQTLEFTTGPCPPELILPGEWDVKGIWLTPKQE